MANIKIGILEKLGYGTLSVSNNIVVQFVSTFILFFYTDVLGIPPAVAGIVLAIGIIWDGISDPILANFADNRRFKNGERTRPYMLYICGPFALITVFMFMPFTLPLTLKVAYCIFVYLIYGSLTTLFRLPSYAMPTLATPNHSERLSINTFASGGATLGGVLASVMCWPLVRLFSGLNPDRSMINPQRGFPMTAVVIGLLIIAGSLFSYFNSRERVLPKSEKEEKLSLLQSFKITMADYNFRWNTAFSTLYFINNALLTTTLVYYCTYVYKNSGAVTAIMGTFAIGSLIALPFIKKVDNSFGRRKAMMLGALLILLSRIPFVILPHNIISMYVTALIMGLSVALNIVTFSTNRAVVSDHVEYVNNRRLDSMVINFMGFFNKCGNSFTTLGIGLVLQFAGYQANVSNQPASVALAMVFIIGWASIAFSSLMIFCGSKITVEKVLLEMNKGANHV